MFIFFRYLMATTIFITGNSGNVPLSHHIIITNDWVTTIVLYGQRNSKSSLGRNAISLIFMSRKRNHIPWWWWGKTVYLQQIPNGHKCGTWWVHLIVSKYHLCMLKCVVFQSININALPVRVVKTTWSCVFIFLRQTCNHAC